MTKVRATERGFPAGCPLPDQLKEEVLAETTRNTRRAGVVCRDMADRTKVYRDKCSWCRGNDKAYGIR
jgi:hypothetical protein